MQAPHFESHLLAQIGVEVGQRLVEQQGLGLDYERAGKCNALLLAARQLARVARSEIGELGGGENCRNFLGHFLARQFTQRKPIGHIVGDCHVRPQRVALKDHRHLPRFGRKGAPGRRQHPIADHDFSGRRFNETRDQAQRRGLAAAGGSEQADQQPVLDAQRHVVDHRRFVISLGQIPQFDRRHAESPYAFPRRFLRRERVTCR